jgi:hypothetical protein
MSVQAEAQERVEIQRRMLVGELVDRQMNQIVRQVCSLVDNTELQASSMEKHQFSNLLGVALETSSVESVANFIRYQMGRDVRGNSWRNKDFGDRLIKELQGLRGVAEAIAGDVAHTVRTGELSPIDVDAIWAELVRQYVGQLNRYFYYKKEAMRWSK